MNFGKSVDYVGRSGFETLGVLRSVGEERAERAVVRGSIPQPVVVIVIVCVRGSLSAGILIRTIVRRWWDSFVCAHQGTSGCSRQGEHTQNDDGWGKSPPTTPSN